MEIGDEEFLKAEFGCSSEWSPSRPYASPLTLSLFFPVPVIVVFTMYDLFRMNQENEIIESSAFQDCPEDEINDQVEKAVETEYERLCLEPLKRQTGGRDLPYANVSSERSYCPRRVATLK